MTATRPTRRRLFLTALTALTLSALSVVALGRDKPVEGLSTDQLETIETLPKVPEGLNEGWHLVREKSKSVKATYTFRTDAPSLQAHEWLLFLPSPVDHPAQRIVQTKTTPDAETVHDLSARRQPLLRWRTLAGKDGAEASSMEWKLEIRAGLFSRRLAEGKGAKSVAGLSESERLLSLRPTREFDYRADAVEAFAKNHELARKKDEGEVDFGRRVFQAVVRNHTYHYVGDQDRRASAVLRAGKSDCGGLAIVFASLMRAQGIPARTIAGRWATSAKEGETVGSVVYFQEHVKGEFWADGLGWVPVDLSSGVLHDKTEEKLRYFGNDPGDFLVFHLDTGITFDSVHFGEHTYSHMQRPSYWATGRGNFDGSSTAETWTVK